MFIGTLHLLGAQVGEDLDGEAADDYQGWSVSLSSNGLTLAVGAYGHESNKGTVRIYNIEAEKLGSANKGTVTLNSQSNTWSQIGNDIDGSGSSSDSSEERWSSTLDGEAGDKQGYSVSISSDGTTLAVGALGHDNNKGTIRAYSLVTSNDLDEDGVLNNKDKCPNTPKGNIVDLDGCTVFTLPLDNNKVSVTSASCIGTTDGSIGLSIEDASFDYSITVTGKDDPIVITGENKTASVSGLAKGTYTVCFKVDGQAHYEQCFEVVIGEPKAFIAFIDVDNDKRTTSIQLAGSKSYNIEVNGERFEVKDDNFTTTFQQDLVLLR